MKKPIILFVSFIVIILSFTSCGLVTVKDLTIDDHPAVDNQTRDDQHEFETYNKHSNTISEYSYGTYSGNTFIIAESGLRYLDSDTIPEVLTSFRNLKDRASEDKLNIKIVYESYTSDNLRKELKDTSISGRYIPDLIIYFSKDVGYYRALGVLAEFEISEYNENFIYRTSVGATSAWTGNIAAASFNTISPDEIPAVIIDSTWLENSGFSAAQILEKVKNGAWLWDDLNEISMTTVSETYKSNLSSDYGEWLIDLAFISTGNNFISLGTSGIPEIGFSPENNESSVKLVRHILRDYPGIASSSEVYNELNKTHVYISDLSSLKDADRTYYILPIPKQYPGSEYRALMPSSACVYSIPSGCDSVERSSDVSSYMNAASFVYVYDNYTLWALNNILPGNDAADILETVFFTPCFDLSVIYGETVSGLYENSQYLIHKAMVSQRWSSNFSDKRDTVSKIIQEKIVNIKIEEDQKETPEESGNK